MNSIIYVHRFTVKSFLILFKNFLYIFGSLVYNIIKKGGDYMATNRPRYTVSVDDELFKQIEDFRFEQRFNTRSEATVELIRLGLEYLKNQQENENFEKK